MSVDQIMAELAQYRRIADEAKKATEDLENQLKKIMTAEDSDEIIGTEHKVTWHAYTQNNVDTARLKREMPEIAAQFMKATPARRFLFT